MFPELQGSFNFFLLFQPHILRFVPLSDLTVEIFDPIAFCFGVLHNALYLLTTFQEVNERRCGFGRIVC